MQRLFWIFVTLLLVSSCSKVPGEGGKAKIKGTVMLEYRLVLSNPGSVQLVVPAADENVFITYGDNTGPDDRVETNFDGQFEFRNLRPGEYTIYVYSKDTTGLNTMHPDKMPITVLTEISDKDQTVQLDEITIYDKE